MTTINPIECISGNTRNKLQVSEKSIFKVNLDGKRVCFVFNTGIGDVIFATPLARHLKFSNPNIKIEFAVPASVIKLLNGSEYIDRVFPIRELPARQGYMDYLYNFGMAITKHMEAETMPAVKAYFRYIDKNFDSSKYDDEYFRPCIPLNENAVQYAKNLFKAKSLFKYPVVALQLKASHPIRWWLPDYNREVAFALAKKGYKVILFDTDPFWMVQADNIFSGKWDLHVVLAMLSLCDLIIAPDSSFIQFGLALKKPTIGIYGAFPGEYRMMGLKDSYPIECDRKDFRCSPCFQHKVSCPKGHIPSPCMESIKPNRVLEVAESILEKSNKKERCLVQVDKKEVVCTFCGSNKYQILTEWGTQYDDTGRICNNCKSIYDPEKKTETMFSIYNNPSYFKDRYANKGYVKDCEYIFNSLLEILPKKSNPVKIADIGCGIGTLASMLKTLPSSQVYGIDISTHAGFLAKKVNSFDVNVKNFLKDVLWIEGYLDLIVFSHYLEHSGGLELIKNLSKAHYYLKEGGLLYIYSPSADAFQRRALIAFDDQKWIHLSGGDHIDIFSKEGLAILLEKSGFKVITIRDRGGDDLDCIAIKE